MGNKNQRRRNTRSPNNHCNGNTDARDSHKPVFHWTIHNHIPHPSNGRNQTHQRAREHHQIGPVHMESTGTAHTGNSRHPNDDNIPHLLWAQLPNVRRTDNSGGRETMDRRADRPGLLEQTAISRNRKRVRGHRPTPGFTYESVESMEDANLRIWIDSWTHLCKWPTNKGFANLEPDPGPDGSRSGDIHICKFTTPQPLARRMTSRSLIAHETAHIFAAQEHTGSGLMANAGGDGSPWFNQDEIRKMCDKINESHEAARAKSEDSRPSAPATRCG